MAISQTRYVNITSGVGGQAVAGNRELIARVMTSNVLAPTNEVIEFSGGASSALNNVLKYFGFDSKEYAFASKYFGYISKDAIQPKKLSFARYTQNATAPQLISTEDLPTIAVFQGISDGSFVISLGGVSYSATDINLSSVQDYTGLSSALQTAIRGNTQGGDMFTQATVGFENNHLTITGGVSGVADVEVLSSASEGTDLSKLLKLDITSNPVVSKGTKSETPAEAMARIDNANDNFGSFCFIDELTTEQITALAQWTNAGNVKYMYSQQVSAENAQTVSNAVKGLNGVALTLGNSSIVSYIPMAIGSCMDYENVNANTNFMFVETGDTPMVESDADADKYDAMRVNYVGATQKAGKKIAFYQRGVLQGDIQSMNVYWNEMWLKDAIVTEFLNLLLAVKVLPANESGEALGKGIVSAVVSQAKDAGVISVGKTLTTVQKAYITELTGNKDAWRDVESVGYWLTVSIRQEVDSAGVTQYIVNYTLIYSKGDVINKVEGRDILL